MLSSAEVDGRRKVSSNNSSRCLTDSTNRLQIASASKPAFFAKSRLSSRLDFSLIPTKPSLSISNLYNAPIENHPVHPILSESLRCSLYLQGMLNTKKSGDQTTESLYNELSRQRYFLISAVLYIKLKDRWLRHPIKLSTNLPMTK